MALIPPIYLDCVVAIGIDSEKSERIWIASGFLFGYFQKRDKEKKKSLYSVYLVTNRHVLEGTKIIYLRFNPKDNNPAQEFPLPFTGVTNPAKWHSHPDPLIDLAIVRINPNILEQAGIQFSYFRSDNHIADRNKMNELGITEGDYGYVLGFPMGLIGKKRNFVITRHGTIARIRDFLSGHSKEILFDSLIFPGNSGGPVITKPEVVAIKKTSPQLASYLIGIIKEYIPYQDVAVSMQTKRPRIIFEDNSGLALVVPIDFVLELIKSLESTKN